MNRRSFMTAFGVGAAGAFGVVAVTPSRHFAQKAEAADYGIPYWCQHTDGPFYLRHPFCCRSNGRIYDFRDISASLDYLVEAIQYHAGQNASEVIELVRPRAASIWNGSIRLGPSGNWYDCIFDGEWVVRHGGRDEDHFLLTDESFKILFQNA